MFRKFLKDYFTFTRSERNGLVVLIIIILILIVVRLIIPHIRQDKTYDFSEFQDEINEFEKTISEADENPEEIEITKKDYGLFLFDPNTATREELLNLGLEPGVVRNILKYRDHGGIFRIRQDLKKIYGLDSVSYLRIEPFILIPAPKDASFKVPYRDSIKQYPDVGDDRSDTFRPLPLNISDSAALTGIYGIGPVLSARIIKYRYLLGGYVSKEQLLEVYGMTDENFEHICNAIYIDTATITPININTADFVRLRRHPYLNDYQARAIIAYREINGKFNKTNEIEKNSLLPQDVYLKLKPYLTVE
jgi:DNA uptake protein ComE-like DNA-binding protein